MSITEKQGLVPNNSKKPAAYDVTSVPLERIAVLVGEKGRDKKMLEKLGDVRINLDSKTGEVVITAKTAEAAWLAKQVVDAVAIGFSPRVASKLFKQNYSFEVIDLLSFAKNKKDLRRVKARVIGKGGSAKRKLQKLANVWICVSEQEVMLIGASQHIEKARDAIETLLAGAGHGNVYNFIKGDKKE